MISGMGAVTSSMFNLFEVTDILFFIDIIGIIIIAKFVQKGKLKFNIKFNVNYRKSVNIILAIIFIFLGSFILVKSNKKLDEQINGKVLILYLIDIPKANQGYINYHIFDGFFTYQSTW